MNSKNGVCNLLGIFVLSQEYLIVTSYCPIKNLLESKHCKNINFKNSMKFVEFRHFFYKICKVVQQKIQSF